METKKKNKYVVMEMGTKTEYLTTKTKVKWKQNDFVSEVAVFK